MKQFTFTVNEEFNNFRLVDFLKKQGVSCEIILKIKYGGIFVNGVVNKNVNDPLKTNDAVKFILPPDIPNEHLTPVKGDLKILYEDEYMLAIVKERGILTHKLKFNDTPSLDALVTGYFLPYPFTFRAVNRLDKDTSGILLIAKDEFTASLLGEKIKNGEIIKTYTAVVVGKPKADKFIIEKPIKKPENSIKRYCEEGGKYAKTECFFVKDLGNGLSLVDLILHTGRTHQIRVHLSSVGLPLYADSLYGREVKGKTYILHAKGLSFIHPFTNEKIELTSQIDIDKAF